MSSTETPEDVDLDMYDEWVTFVQFTLIGTSTLLYVVVALAICLRPSLIKKPFLCISNACSDILSVILYNGIMPVYWFRATMENDTTIMTLVWLPMFYLRRVSSLNVMAIAANRVVAVGKPIAYKTHYSMVNFTEVTNIRQKIWTMRRVLKTIMICWLLPTVYLMPGLFESGRVHFVPGEMGHTIGSVEFNKFYRTANVILTTGIITPGASFICLKFTS